MRIHHVGIAVESLEKAVASFELLLGAPPVSEEVVEDQQVRVAVFQMGESRIELLEALSPDSPVAHFIGKRGPGIHHLTLEVEGLKEKLDQLDRSGVRLVDRKPRAGAGNKSIAFLHPSSMAGILIELLQGQASAQAQTDPKAGEK